jgi:hypothetical protein
MKVAMPKPRSAFAEISPFAAEVFVESGIVDVGRCIGRRRVLFVELLESILTCVDVAQQIKVMIQEVCLSLVAATSGMFLPSE